MTLSLSATQKAKEFEGTFTPEYYQAIIQAFANSADLSTSDIKVVESKFTIKPLRISAAAQNLITSNDKTLTAWADGSFNNLNNPQLGAAAIFTDQFDIRETTAMMKPKSKKRKFTDTT